MIYQILNSFLLPSLYAPKNTLDLQFSIDIQSADYAGADSIKIVFPEGIKINSTRIFTSYGYEIAYFDKKIEGQVITWVASSSS